MQRRHLLLASTLAAAGCATREAPESLLSDSSVSQLLMPAQPDLGFHFPYILQTPVALPEVVPHIVVETNNSGPISPDVRPHVRPTSELAKTGLGGRVSAGLRLPLVMPVFPRSTDLYTHSLGRSTILTDKQSLRRLDLQVLAMSRDAMKRIRTRGALWSDRIILTGFSASAMFATRMAILHPHAVQAIAAGGLNGFVILPEQELGGEALTYPLGTNDLQQLSGAPFDQERWQQIPQYLFMGELDTNDAVDFEDSYSVDHRKLIHTHLGREMMPTRWNACMKIYAESGANATFVTYTGIGHGTNGRIHAEVTSFLGAASASAPA